MPESKMMRSVAMLLTLVAMFVNVGCKQTTYGSGKHPVKLDSDPQGATAYIVPYNVWLDEDGATKLARHDTAWLEKYREKSGVTPVDVKLMPYHTVYVVSRDGRYEFTDFTPHMDNPVVKITFPK